MQSQFSSPLYKALVTTPLGEFFRLTIGPEFRKHKVYFFAEATPLAQATYSVQMDLVFSLSGSPQAILPCSLGSGDGVILTNFFPQGGFALQDNASFLLPSSSTDFANETIVTAPRLVTVKADAVALVLKSISGVTGIRALLAVDSSLT